ncbi:protein kinase domain-containing protein [Arenimonas sp. MALMAid1274]|uniref:protein kinase domain-containing protein n=1 Tax=Arenimonas sp. MALMAid1274 TaxID=3411630 RepID=UPI003BA2D9C2
MTHPLHWPQVEALFDAAWELPDAERRAWILAQPASEAVRRAACDLLDAAIASERFLDAEADAGTTDTDATTVDRLAPGDRAGAWRVLRNLGRGGMGEVYEVERADGQFTQRAALKVITRADARAWDGFNHERQILAHLDHPGIARLIDGSLLEGGTPFMVMELVDGAPIDAWCESHGASLDARVALVQQACEALAHAHGKLVVHHDLKPSNLLVDAGGRVRLIDFGIARLAGQESGAAVAALSQDYAAPEQATGAGTSTATDVHGLAAVLYRLVSGKPPRNTAGLSPAAALARIVSTPPRPLREATDAGRWRSGSAERALFEDLDAILAKALATDPAHRYATVDQFCDELAQARQRGPVAARAHEPSHRMARQLHRHRWSVAAGATVLLSLAVGLGLALGQAREAARQRDQALGEQKRLEAVQQALFLMFRGAGELRGGEATAADVLGHAAQRVQDEFDRNPGEAAPILHALGELNFLITDYEAAAPMLERLAGASSAQVDPRLIAAGRYDLAQVRFRQGDAAAARPLLAQAQAFWRSDLARWESRLVDSRLLESQLTKAEGDVDGAIALLREGLQRRIALSGAQHRETGIFHNNLGVALFGAGRMDEARDAFQSARAVWQATGLQQTPDALNTLNNWGAVEVASGRPTQAEPLFREAVDLRRRYYGPSAATAALLSNHGKLLLATGRPEDALPVLREAAAMGARFAGHGSLHHVAALSGQSEAELALQRIEAAALSAETALAAALETLGRDHPGTGMASLAVAAVAGHQQRWGDADALLREVERIATSAGPAGARLTAQASVLRDRYRVPGNRPGPGTATPAP